MAKLIHVASGDYPLSVQDVRARHPLTSFIDPFEPPIGYAWVRDSAQPDFNPIRHQAVEIAPVLSEGVWNQAWSIQALAPEAVTAAIESAQLDLIARATTRRWEIETGGITLPNGVQIATGTADQNRVTTVIANADLAGIDTVKFKAASGWVTLSLDQVRGIAAASALHVQACFTAECAHHEAIAALTDPEQIHSYNIDAGWPAQSLGDAP